MIILDIVDPEVLPAIPDGAKMVVQEEDKIYVYFPDDAEYIAMDVQAPFRNYAKILIKADCSKMITSGFTSSATGSSQSYRTGIEDQLNIISSSISNSGGRVDSDGMKVRLNPAQINSLRDDFVAFREALLDEVDSRSALIDASTSAVEIQSLIDKAW